MWGQLEITEAKSSVNTSFCNTTLLSPTKSYRNWYFLFENSSGKYSYWCYPALYGFICLFFSILFFLRWNRYHYHPRHHHRCQRYCPHRYRHSYHHHHCHRHRCIRLILIPLLLIIITKHTKVWTMWLWWCWWHLHCGSYF